MSKLISGLLLGGLFILYPLSCGDDYMTIERNIIDTDSKVPMYFYADAEQAANSNSWRPVFTYYIYLMEEGEYDAYFHAYCVQDDSVIWSGVQPIVIEGRKKIWGEYVSEAEFSPHMMPNIIPMAYVSVEY